MKEVSPRKARQGRQGWHVLTILVVSLVLAMIVWGAVAIWGRAQRSDNFMNDEHSPPATAPTQTPPSGAGAQ